MKKNDETESSNEEETFNDCNDYHSQLTLILIVDFQNPQKRKQFDNVRLYQQQKELSKMSGYNKQFSLEYPKKLKENSQQKNYATVSLCCLTVTNPFRDKIIRLVLNPWFDRVILVVIIANCCFLAIDNPMVEPLQYQRISDYIFLTIFTVEMVFKVIAMGFAFRPHSYLRDTWNILDFIVVIVGWIGKVFQQKNISAIRVIRILRPLRTVNSMPGMRKLVQSLLNSLPTLFDILILFIFFLIMFGTVGNQLFEGILINRCITPEGLIQSYDDGYEYMCAKDSDCDVINGYVCKEYGNPNNGVTSFDNIFKSVLNIFIIITLEGWTDIMYLVRKATHTIAYDIFFVATVIFGTFFVLNLMIAVQFTYLNASFEEDQQKRKEELEEKEDNMTPKESVTNSKSKANKSNSIGQASNFEDALNKLQKQDNQIANNEIGSDSFQKEPSKQELVNEEPCNEVEEFKEQQEDPNIKKDKKQRRCGKIRDWSDNLELVVESKAFNIIVILFILFNSIFLALEYDNMPVKMSKIINIGNQVFTAIFAVEMILKVMGLGVKKYVMDGFNVFDAIIVIVGILDFFHFGSRAITVLRAFRLLRIFKIVRSWTSLRKLLQTVFQSFNSISNLALLMFLLIFIYALIGMQFLNGKFDKTGDSFRCNFNTFGYSLITVFILITGENWNSILYGFIEKDGFIASLYFVSIIIIGNMMLLNLFLAILLNYISDNLDENEQALQNQEENEDMIEQSLEYLNEKRQLKSSLVVSLKQSVGTPVSQAQRIQQNIKIEDIRINLKKEEGEHHITEKSQEDDSHSEFVHTRKNIVSSNIQEFEIPYKSDRRLQEMLSKEEESQAKTGIISIRQKKDFDLKNSLNLASSKLSRKKKLASQIELTGKSLLIFKANSKFRLFLKQFLEHPFSENFIYHMIGLNSLLLALDEPVLSDPYQKQTLKFLQLVISVVFIVEAALKIFALGFVIGKGTYLRDPWNILDFCIVVFSIFNWLIALAPTTISVSFLRGFRALRALRPLRMVSKNEGMKNVVNSLLKSIPNLLNVLLICLLFYLVFGILGVQLFKGSSGSCNDVTISDRYSCIGTYYDTTLQQYQDRVWSIPYTNFDNVFYSMLTFFEVSTLENWPATLFQVIDSVGEDKGPKLDNRPQMAVVFIVFIFITTFFVMNLFISVIVDKFNEEIRKKDGSHNFSEEQKEWVKMQRIMVTVNVKVVPIVPINKIRKICFRIVQSNKFEYFIIFIILFNTLLLCMDYLHSPELYGEVINDFNICFVVIFTLECIFKMIAYGFRYFWHENWNKLDLAIVVLSLISLDPKIFNFNVTALRIIRVARLLRMIKASRGLRHLLKTLYMSLENIMNVGMLLSLIFFTFSVAGMDLFGNVPNGMNITEDANFRSFYKSFLTLVRAATGENWNTIMGDCIQSAGSVSIFYWVIFTLLAHFIFLNVFVAVICENFNDIKSSEDVNEVLSLKRKDIKAFINTWAYFNPNGALYMKTIHFPAFLQELPPPLGYEGIKIEQSKLNKIIFCLNIRDHQGRVYFPEVMWAIFHSIIGNNDEKVHKCEQVINIMKILKRKYKGLGKNISPDSLCGNKFYKNEMTISKYLCAMQIVNNWRKYKEQRIQMKADRAELKRKQDAGLSVKEERDTFIIRQDDAKIKEEIKEESLEESKSFQKQRADDYEESKSESSSDKSDSYNVNQGCVSSDGSNPDVTIVQNRALNTPVNKGENGTNRKKVLVDESQEVGLKEDDSVSIMSEEISQDRKRLQIDQLSHDVKKFDFTQLKGDAKESKQTDQQEADTPRLDTKQNEMKGIREFQKNKNMEDLLRML